jgi:hypothetical protein
MSDERTLRWKIREAILSGKFPGRSPERTSGGPSGGADCALCGEPIRPLEVELELEFARGEDDPGRDTYNVHPRCHFAWASERYDIE